MEVRERYVQELQFIRSQIISMTELCIRQVQSAIEALESDNDTLAQRVLEIDPNIDEREIEISNSCIKFIAREQPVASDLRELISIIKFVSSIARIGDHARHLVEGRKWFSERSRGEFLPLISEMAELGIRILKTGIQSLNEEAEELKRVIPELDARIGSLKKKLSKRIENYMRESPDHVEEGAGIFFLNRFMERFGDHAANFCEWVYFAKTGVHIELN